MGVLSKASLAFAFDGLADTLVPIESTSYRRAVAKSGLFMGGVQPFSEKNAVLPVFEFVEARRSAISFNAGRQAYEAAFSGDYSGAEHSYVRGKVVMQIEAGKMGKPTVKAVKLSVRLLRLEPSSIGVGELLFEKELWKANSPTGFEELDGTMEYSFSIPIHPNLAASFAELPVLSSASEGASNLKGASYNLMAVLTRPSMPDIETTYPVLLRNAVPPHYIREERVSVHKGSLGPGKPSYKITTPRVVPVSDSATFPVTVQLFSPNGSLPASWHATSRITEWFGAVPKSQFQSFSKPKAEHGGMPRISDGIKVKTKPVKATEEVEGVLSPAAWDEDDMLAQDGGAAAEEATLAGGEGPADDDDVELINGSESFVAGTIQVPTAGLRADWCDGILYSSHAVEIVLAPAPKDGGVKSKLVAARSKKRVVRVPIHVVYAAEAKPEVYAAWRVDDGWDEWPWRKYTQSEGYKPLWEVE